MTTTGLDARELSRAIAANELQVYVQPQIDLATAEVVAVEGLSRWTHPTRGPIPPAEFIALAESSGLIHESGSLRPAGVLSHRARLARARIRPRGRGQRVTAAARDGPLLRRIGAAAGRVRTSTGRSHRRGDRSRADRRLRCGRRTAGRHPAVGRDGLHRRLRLGTLLDRTGSRRPCPGAEDRPQSHRSRRLARRRRGGRARQSRRHAGGRGGNRDARAVGARADGRMRPCAGLLHRPAKSTRTISKTGCIRSYAKFKVSAPPGGRPSTKETSGAPQRSGRPALRPCGA